MTTKGKNMENKYDKKSINGQYGIFEDAPIENNANEKNPEDEISVKIYRIVIKENTKALPGQISILKQNDDPLSFLTKPFPEVEFKYNNKNVSPDFNLISHDNKLFFFSYINKSNFNKKLTKLINKTDMKEINVDEKKLILEHYTFFVMDILNKRLAVINNRDTNSWSYALVEVFKYYNLILDLIPKQRTDLDSKLMTDNIKQITFSTESPEIIQKKFFSQMDPSRNYDDNKIVTKLAATLSFEKTTEKKIKKAEFAKENFLAKKEQYKSVAIQFENEIYNVCDNTFSLQVKINLPDSFKPGSSGMEELRNKLIELLQKNS